jgi:hypothetical protein
MHIGLIKQLMEPIMKSLIRRHLLILMLGVTAATLSLSAYSPAFAKDGHSGSDSSSDSDGSSGSDSDSDSDGDSSGSDSDSDSDGDSSESGGDDDGPGHDSDDDSSDDGGHHSSGSDDDNSDDDNSDDSSSNSGGRDRQRPEIELSLDAASLAGVRNGSLTVVDNLGRVLEVEFDTVNGSRVATGKPHGGDAKRNPGPIASVSVVPSSQAPVHQ